MATYVFALVARGRTLALPRTLPSLPQASAPALLAVRPGWWLVVCDVPLSAYGTDGLQRRMSDLEWISTVAVAHEAVIEAFLRADAVLPLKLFSIFSTPARACAHFLEREAHLREVIGRVTKAEEWGVRVALRAQPARQAVPARTTPSSGAGYLLGKRAQYQSAASRQGRVRQLASELFDALATLSSATKQRQEAQAPGGLVLDAAFLVPRVEATHLKAAATRYARALKPEGGDVTLTGPWPPYSFVQD